MTIYSKEVENQLLDLNYIVLWKNDPEIKSILKPLVVVIYLWKLINIFYKKHLKNPITTFLLLDFILLMVKIIILKSELKQMCNYSNKNSKKDVKSDWILDGQDNYNK